MLSYEKIHFGPACNNRCTVCDVPADDTPRSLNELVRQVDALSDPENVELSGGEPSLHEGLLPLISHIRRRGGKRIKLRTNGRTLADRGVLQTLVREGCRIFEVSLFGAGPNTHEAVTRVRASFDETLKGFEALSAHSSMAEADESIYITARIGVMDENVEDLLPMVSLLMSYGVDVLRFVRMGARLPVRQGAQAVATAMKVATLNRVWSLSEGFPPCIMKGSECHLTELIQPKTFPGNKPKSCNTCVFSPLCAGPPEGYGQRDFRAVATFPYFRGLEYLMELTASRAN